MTAIGWRAATVGDTSSPVIGAGTSTGVGTGVGDGDGVAVGEAVGDDVAVGVALGPAVVAPSRPGRSAIRSVSRSTRRPRG